MSQQGLTEIGLWLLAVFATAFWSYLLLDGLAHRLKWRRLIRKGRESRDRE